MTRHKITPGFDGEVRYLAHRNVWVGFMGGKVVVTKNTESAVITWFANKKGTITKPTAKTVDVSVREEIFKQVEEVWNRAKSLYNLDLPLPAVDFYNRGRAAGRAYRYKHFVEFNEVLAKENRDKFKETVIHELAHLVVFNKYPNATAHGHEFKSVDRTLGGRGTRCHSYDVTNVASKKSKTRVELKCACQTHWVTVAMSKKSGLKCRKCGAAAVKTGATKTFM